jgi:hypothetical protein
MSAASLVKFLSINRLSFPEEILVEAVAQWAQQKSVEAGDDLGEKLRENVLIGLQHIAFPSLSHHSVAFLFENSLLKTVLSAKEQLAILMAVFRNNWNYLPNQIMPIEQNQRRFPYSIVPLSLEKCCGLEEAEYTGHAITSFPFEINCNAELIGIKFRWMDELNYKFSLEDTVGCNTVCIVNDTAQNIIFHKGKQFCKLNTAPSLRAGTVYRFTFTHSCSVDHADGITMYTSPTDKILARSADDGLQMKIFESQIYDLVDSFLFEKIK